ncbi:MAG: helix-turn-helix domain-containing protein [Lawsonibacter sp.]
MDFQQRLYEMRKQSSLSQEGLASLLGVTRQAVQKWESGSSRPDMDNLAALARYFNVSLDYLVTGQERTAPPPAATTIIHNHYSRWHYEYKSSRTLFGLPLIHIRLGERGLCTARGIIAIGNCAVGALSIGGFSFGLVSVGGLSLGLLFSLGEGCGRARHRRARPGPAGLRRGGGRILLPGRLRLWRVRGRRSCRRLKDRHRRSGLRPSGHRADGGRGPHLRSGC